LVATPDRHLIVQDGRARLFDGTLVSRVKPAIDSLFASAAHDYLCGV
jgi:chemotaxis response regulator CheB